MPKRKSRRVQIGRISKINFEEQKARSEKQINSQILFYETLFKKKKKNSGKQKRILKKLLKKEEKSQFHSNKQKKTTTKCTKIV